MNDWMIYYQSLQEWKTDLFVQLAHLRNDVRGVTGNDPIDLSSFLGEAVKQQAKRMSEEETRQIKQDFSHLYTSDATG